MLLLVSDTLRSDALSCYGGPTRTPNICRLAERGVLFENAYSGGAWTLPSSVAMFTGQYPTVFAREGGAPKQPSRFYFVPRSEVLLAELLNERGYESVAFVESGIAHKPRPFQGFDVRNVSEPGPLEARFAPFAAELSLDSTDFRSLQVVPILHYLLEESEGPFFAVQWFRDPHATYAPPARYFESIEVPKGELPHPLEWYARLAAREDSARGWLDFEALVPDMSEREIEAVRSLYHREVEFVDERVGWILDALERRGLSDETLVIFTSDHGEGFGEHGKFFHADKWFYEEFVRIPLIAAGPGLARGLRVPQATSHVDLVPTLRELLQVEASAADQGTSLARLLRGEDDVAPERFQYLVGTSRLEGHAALVDGRYKLIARPDSEELYDLARDPAEERDLSGDQPAVVARMRRRMNSLLAENLARREQRHELADREDLRRVDRETDEALRAIGYIE